MLRPAARPAAPPRHPPVPTALGGLLGLLGGTAAQCLAWWIGVLAAQAVSTVPTARAVAAAGLVLGAATAAAVATVTTVGGTAVAALLCWALDDGFGVNRLGELHLAAADRHALVGIALAAAAAHGVAALVRLDPIGRAGRLRAGHLERLVPPSPWVPAIGSRGRLWS